MLAIRINRVGGPEVLDVADVLRPSPAAGEILVRHEAIGLNFIDIYHRTGLYPLPLPSGIGLEAAGIVEAIGAGVTRFAIGDRVAYAAGPIGAYAEAHVVPAARAVAIPTAIDTRTAAAALLKGMTAEFLLRRCAPVTPGQAVLIHAAAGGVGSLLVQWAKALGATVIATAGSPGKRSVAAALGADHVLDSGAATLAEQVRGLTGGDGVAIVYDGVGAATFDASLASLARRGHMVSFGNASGPLPPIDALRLMRAGSLHFTRPTMMDYLVTTEELDASAAALFDVLVSGAIKMPIGGEWPLAEAAAAHVALAARATQGAGLLIP